MEKQVIFKSALNGFDKTAVLKHIDILNSKMSQSEVAHQEAIAALTQEKEAVEDKLSELENEIMELGKTILEKDEQLSSNKEQLIYLEKELEKLSSLVEEQKKELLSVREENRILQEQITETGAKVKKYDETAASIGDVILVARQNATHITDEAKMKAEKILAEAKEKSEKMLADAKQKVDESNEQMETLKARFNIVRKTMNDSIAAMQAELEHVAECIDPVKKEELKEAAEVKKAETASEEVKAENPLKAILEQAANSTQKKNFFQ